MWHACSLCEYRKQVSKRAYRYLCEDLDLREPAGGGPSPPPHCYACTMHA